MSDDQVIHLEAYEPQVKLAFGRAQALADERKHTKVTWHHLLRIMLDVGWGREACARAGVDPDDLVAVASAALDALPAAATEVSYLDANLLAVMKEAETAASALGRKAVDFQCIFVALGKKEHVEAAIGEGAWSEEERTGSTKKAPPTFESALGDSAKSLDGLADRIAAALGRARVPREVRRTLDKLRACFRAPNDVPDLLVERHDDGPLLIGREGHDESVIVVQWAPPLAIEVVTGEGAARVTLSFELARETNTWRAGDAELFEAVRAAVMALYPEATRLPN